MKTFTIKDIESWDPCYPPTDVIPEDWQGTAIDMLNNEDVPFNYRLWCVFRAELMSEKLMRLFAVWCARQVQHLMTDERSLKALDVAEKFANGEATKEQLDADGAAARDAWAAGWTDAVWAARTASAVARTAARDAQKKKLIEMIEAENGLEDER